MSTNAPLLADKVSWDGRKLVATGDGVVDQLRRKALSASTNKSMQSCAARWAGERLLPRNEMPFDPAPLGTSAHAVMEDLLGLEPSARNVPRARALTLAAAEKMWPDSETEAPAVRAAVANNRRRWIEEVIICWLGLFTIEDPSKVNVYAREMSIDNTIINGVPSNGFIDRVEYGDMKGKPGLISVDYKTGKVPEAKYLKRSDEHGDQIRVYTVAVEALTGTRPVGGRIYYTKHAVSRDVDISQAAIDKTLTTFKSSWNKHNKYMKEATFPTKTSPLCGWCPLVNACPAAKAEGKTAQKEGLPSAVALGIPTIGAPRPVTVPAMAGAPVGAPENSSVRTAVAESARVFAAHIAISTNDRSFLEEEEHMTIITEGKMWEPLTIEGELNPNSYAAMGVFGITQIAVDELNRAGIDLTKQYVTSLAQTLSFVIARAQESWTGSTSAADGANSRMRGALRTVLGTMPLPFGGDENAWYEWALSAVKRMRAITAVSLELWAPADGLRSSNPWVGMAGVQPKSEKVVTPLATAPSQAAIEAPVVVAVPAPVVVAEPEPEPAPVKRAPAPKSVARRQEPVELFPDDDDISAADAA